MTYSSTFCKGSRPCGGAEQLICSGMMLHEASTLRKQDHMRASGTNSSLRGLTHMKVMPGQSTGLTGREPGVGHLDDVKLPLAQRSQALGRVAGQPRRAVKEQPRTDGGAHHLDRFMGLSFASTVCKADCLQ